MAGDDPRRSDEREDQREERQIETAEQERRRLEDVPASHGRDGLDHVRRALRRHDSELKEPEE
jgi:hypothetical protein